MSIILTWSSFKSVLVKVKNLGKSSFKVRGPKLILERNWSVTNPALVVVWMSSFRYPHGKEEYQLTSSFPHPRLRTAVLVREQFEQNPSPQFRQWWILSPFRWKFIRHDLQQTIWLLGRQYEGFTWKYGSLWRIWKKILHFSHSLCYLQPMPLSSV